MGEAAERKAKAAMAEARARAAIATIASAAVNKLDWNAQFTASDKSSTFKGEVQFNWIGGHNVYEMADKDAYDACSFAGAKNLGDTSPVAVSADVGKTKYYSCDVGSHCSYGQKVAITWTDVATDADTSGALAPSA